MYFASKLRVEVIKTHVDNLVENPPLSCKCFLLVYLWAMPAQGVLYAHVKAPYLMVFFLSIVQLKVCNIKLSHGRDIRLRTKLLSLYTNMDGSSRSYIPESRSLAFPSIKQISSKSGRIVGSGCQQLVTMNFK